MNDEDSWGPTWSHSIPFCHLDGSERVSLVIVGVRRSGPPPLVFDVSLVPIIEDSLETLTPTLPRVSVHLLGWIFVLQGWVRSCMLRFGPYQNDPTTSPGDRREGVLILHFLSIQRSKRDVEERGKSDVRRDHRSWGEWLSTCRLFILLFYPSLLFFSNFFLGSVPM